MNLSIIASYFALAFAVTDLYSAAVEWPTSAGGNGHRYEVVATSSPISWSAADNAARQRGGHLATVTSSVENAFIRSAMASFPQRHYWLGGFQQPGSAEPTGGWSWVTSEPFVFNAWATTYYNNSGAANPTQEPNDYGGGENWLEMIPQNGQWNDTIEFQQSFEFATFGYVVEWEASGILLRDMNDGSLIGKNDIAWITGTPAMPALVAELHGGIEGVAVTWKFKCVFNRARASGLPQDTVQLTKTLPGDQAWNIYDDYRELDFFGGSTELSCVAGVEPVKKLKFQISGKNPEPMVAKAYIQALPEAPWYFYAIAKSESEPGGEIYNQFWAKQVLRNVAEDGSPRNMRIFAIGDPLWGRDAYGYGGWGMLQLTPKTPVPRKEIWNWKENAKSALALLESKIRASVQFMRAQRDRAVTAAQVSIPVPNVSYLGETGVNVVFTDGTGRTIEDAVAIKYYNGASKPKGFTNFPDTGHYCYYGRAPLITSPLKWRFVEKNKLGFDYVERVCSRVED